MPRPDRLPAKKRGRTIQNFVLLVMRGVASRVICTVTATWFISGVSLTAVTVPSWTSRCLTWDVPAVSPSPWSKVMVILGPRFE